MERTRRIARIITIFSVAAIAMACGSGGGGGAAPAPAPAPPAAAPQVGNAPGSRAVAVGANVQFSVSALGTAPFTYQWRRNGADIAGATAAAYSLTAALTDDGARFAVVITNPAGSVVSSDAILNVHPTPQPAVTCTGVLPPFSIARDAGATVGKAAGAAVAGCQGGALTALRWSQTAGGLVPLLSDKTQAISFEPPTAGAYSFRADFIDAAETARFATFDFTAAAAAAGSRVTVRADHAVREGGNVSLRAWPTPAAGDAVQSITWSQLSGPAVPIDTSDPLRALFVAPAINVDTALVFRATLRTTQGQVDSDDAYVLVENHTQAPNANEYVFGGEHVSRVYAFRSASPYASALQRCVYDSQSQWQGAGKNTCTLATLPFLGQETGGNEPTVAQIMNRVLVSHDWMGAVFEEFISRSDAVDIRRLFNGVTAVVIGAQVRPSFYYALTGAIYLDADNFWRTAEERDVINEAPDFRSDFDRDLNYTGLWRYTLNNNSVFVFFSPTARVSRTVDYLVYETGWLMYHELAHAGDFLPPSTRASLNSAMTAWDNISPRFAAQQLPSDDLARMHPLASNEMRALAQVKFFGDTASAAQRAYTPPQVGAFFSVDRATDEYNYSTTREDIAMVFEEFMMAHRHGVRRDVAVTSKFQPGMTGSDLVVAWGSRGRVGEASIKPRAQLAVQNVAPWILMADANAANNLAAPIPMRVGDSWTGNLVLPSPLSDRAGGLALRLAASAAEDAWLLERALGHPGTRRGQWTTSERRLRR